MYLDRDKGITDEVISIASSAASMERKALEDRVIHVETQLLMASKINHNKNLHDKILQDTTFMATAIMEMDLYTLWWLIQWIDRDPDWDCSTY